MLREIEANTGVTPPSLENAPWLEGVLREQYLTFEQIAKNRKHSQGGPLPIGDDDLLAYFQVEGTPRELWGTVKDFVMRIDKVWLEEFFDHHEAQANKKP